MILYIFCFRPFSPRNWITLPSNMACVPTLVKVHISGLRSKIQDLTQPTKRVHDTSTNEPPAQRSHVMVWDPKSNPTHQTSPRHIDGGISRPNIYMTKTTTRGRPRWVWRRNPTNKIIGGLNKFILCWLLYLRTQMTLTRREFVLLSPYKDEAYNYTSSYNWHYQYSTKIVLIWASECHCIEPTYWRWWRSLAKENSGLGPSVWEKIGSCSILHPTFTRK